MGWRFTEHVEEYARSVWDLLAADPVEHTVALSVIERVRAGHRWSRTTGWGRRERRLNISAADTPSSLTSEGQQCTVLSTFCLPP